MAIYILTVRGEALDRLPEEFISLRKLVSASGHREARIAAANDAKKMGIFDNPKVWKSEAMTECVNVNSIKGFGCIMSEYV